MGEQTTPGNISYLSTLPHDQCHNGGHRTLWEYCKDAKRVQGVREGSLKGVAFLGP